MPLMEGCREVEAISWTLPVRAHRAPVPVLPSSSGLTWRLQEAQGHLLDSYCLSAAAQWIPVLVLPFSSELGEEEVRGLGEG